MGESGSAVKLTRIQEKSSQHFGRLNQLDQQPHQKHDDQSIDSNSRDGADDL